MASSVVHISSRGQSIAALLLRPPGWPFWPFWPFNRVKGAVVLFAGGNGRLDIQPDGSLLYLQENFLVRTRGAYAKAGYVVLLPDLAPDMKVGVDDVVNNYRASEAYAEDCAAMVQYLRGHFGPRVFVNGTSRGTLSVANLVAREAGGLPAVKRPTGQIYSSGYWKLGAAAPGLTIWKLAHGEASRLKLPTLLVINRDDLCPDTDPADLPTFRTWLASGGAPIRLAEFTGGLPPAAGPCEALAAHGFYGLDATVVKACVAWMGQVP